MSAARNPAIQSNFSMDPMLLVVAIALLLVGLIAVTSASIEYAHWHHQTPWYHSMRHLVYISIALTSAYGVYRLPWELWLNTGWVWLFLSLALLILVLIPGVGREVNGSQRWLSLGPFTSQPSEFAKLALVVYLAGYLVRKQHGIRHEWIGFLEPMAVLFSVN